jgi:hypothetical protein
MLGIPGTDLAPNGLFVVGTVYSQSESTVWPSLFQGAPGLCTYVSPPKGLPIVCPTNDDGIRLTFGLTDLPVTGDPLPLWKTISYGSVYTPQVTDGPCTYAGQPLYAGTPIDG